ncbi:hypothetical protein SK128_019707 [Halocaridina rubra]|uniref:Uncharacterized protein n=1 Tax=Halocaridina rubra TaxID=373956 RepID=A0AAN8X311_HALRR
MEGEEEIPGSFGQETLDKDDVVGCKMEEMRSWFNRVGNGGGGILVHGSWIKRRGLLEKRWGVVSKLVLTYHYWVLSVDRYRDFEEPSRTPRLAALMIFLSSRGLIVRKTKPEFSC